MRTLLRAITLATLCSAANAATENGFVIMSADEVLQHRARMSMLQGAERDAYRNSQYQRLRTHARDNGYILPPTPVWMLPADPRVHEMDVIREAHRRAAEAHREDMRKRFDEFMATQQRQIRQTQPQRTPFVNPAYRPYPPPVARYPYPPPGYWRPIPTAPNR